MKKGTKQIIFIVIAFWFGLTFLGPVFRGEIGSLNWVGLLLVLAGAGLVIAGILETVRYLKAKATEKK